MNVKKDNHKKDQISNFILWLWDFWIVVKSSDIVLMVVWVIS